MPFEDLRYKYWFISQVINNRNGSLNASITFKYSTKGLQLNCFLETHERRTIMWK